MKVFSFFLIFFISSCQLIEKNNSFFHLVIDAGSSGTRFCLYEIQKNQNQCMLKNDKENCDSIPSKSGLANLTKEEIESTLNQGFQRINKSLSKIEYISLLGTGGFRKLSDLEQNNKYKILSDYFAKIPVKSKIKFISGEEEAYFAWKSIQILYHSNSHYILETGGATVQFAYGNSSNFSYISLPIGMNSLYESLRTQKDFENCTYGKTMQSIVFDKCQRMVFQEFLRSYKENRIPKENISVYTLGRPWETIFSYAKKNSLTKKELEIFGKDICSKTKEDLEKMYKNGFIERMCYLFYYHVAQMNLFQLEEVNFGFSSWTIGASVSSKTIPYCD